jgi:hypothetical protein
MKILLFKFKNSNLNKILQKLENMIRRETNSIIDSTRRNTNNNIQSSNQSDNFQRIERNQLPVNSIEIINIRENTNRNAIPSHNNFINRKRHRGNRQDYEATNLGNSFQLGSSAWVDLVDLGFLENNTGTKLLDSENPLPNNRANANLYYPVKINKNEIKADTSLVTKDFKEFAEEAKCPICFSLVMDPTACRKCSGIFCRICLDKHFKSKKNSVKDCYGRLKLICPLCKDFKEGEINKKHLNMINCLKLKCPNNQAGCQAIILYEHIVSHMEGCDFKDYKCIMCGETFSKPSIEAHVNQCGEIIEECKNCKDWAGERKYMEEHKEECEMRQIYCKFCDKQMCFKDKQTHTEKCCWDVICFYENLLKMKNINTNFFSAVYAISKLKDANMTIYNYTIKELSNPYSFHLLKIQDHKKEYMVMLEFNKSVIINSVRMSIKVDPIEYTSTKLLLLRSFPQIHY